MTDTAFDYITAVLKNEEEEAANRNELDAYRNGQPEVAKIHNDMAQSMHRIVTLILHQSSHDSCFLCGSEVKHIDQPA